MTFAEMNFDFMFANIFPFSFLSGFPSFTFASSDGASAQLKTTFNIGFKYENFRSEN